MSQRKEALQRKASKWNLIHCESFSKLSWFFPPMMHCSCYLTADHLSVHCTLPLIEYLTSKQLRAITNQRMDSCLWTKAAASLRTSACQSNCRVWTTAWCLWFSNASLARLLSRPSFQTCHRANLTCLPVLFDLEPKAPLLHFLQLNKVIRINRLKNWKNK